MLSESSFFIWKERVNGVPRQVCLLMSCYCLKALYLAVEKKLASEIWPRIGICKSPEVTSFAEGLLQDQNKADANYSGNLLSQ